MKIEPLHWLPGSFFRKPSWRWLRAEYLTATGRRLDPRIDDDWVGHARTALRGRGRAGSKAAAVRAAQEIWAGDHAVKGELEARLLTEEVLGVIAERLRFSHAEVEAYAEVFFAVRAMRRATDWLLTRAVGYSPLRGFIGPQPAAAWKLAALAGGPLLLDVVIAVTTGRPLPAGFLTGTGRRRAYADTRTRLLAEIWVAAMAATTDGEFARVVNARRQLRDLDATMTGRTARVTPLVAAMEAFLRGLPASNRNSLMVNGSSKEGGGAEVVADVVPPAFRQLGDAIASPARSVTDARVNVVTRTGGSGTATGRLPATLLPGRFGREHPARRLAG